MCVALLCCTIYFLSKYLSRSKNIDSRNKFVLISGCDTGFGHSLAIELDNQGFNVLAGVYNNQNLKTLADKLSSRANVFLLDITSQQDIDTTYSLVNSNASSLFGLINNAGIANGGLIDWTSISTMRQVMDVNFFGHVAMTKTFLPLLLTEANSRVINMSSSAGYLAAAGACAYSSSKYALEAFSDCLRREMSVWDLHVSIIEPGFMRTPIIEGMTERMQTLWTNHIDEPTKERWGEAYFSDWLREGTKLATQTADDPKKVVDAVCHAMLSSKPRIRYRPGWQSSLFCFPLSMIPASVTDFLIDLGQRKLARPTNVLNRNKNNTN